MDIIKKPEAIYNPFKLPKALDFHLTTTEIKLPRAMKNKIQVALSKMDKTKLKQTIEYLGDMRSDALKENNYKMAAYCKAVKQFAEAYYKSVLEQRRI